LGRFFVIFTDAHLHIADIDSWLPVSDSPLCSCAHSPAEFALVEDAARRFPRLVKKAFGMHPQNPELSYAPDLERLAALGMLDAIGEAGFDLFTPSSVADSARQEEAWHIQLDAAQRFGLPLIVHCRKALDRVFRDSRALKTVPAVVMHSFMGSPQEARSLRKRGVNAYFSFGKPILNGNKRAMHCVAELEINVLLLETDAPYQTLRDESATSPRDIIRVYDAAAVLRDVSVGQLTEAIAFNFARVFGE
jgi:TatD DNase family protein